MSKNSKEYILIRHGETDYNRDRRFLGFTDIGLNDTGKAQAERLRGLLASEMIDALYASDLLRCRETAEALTLAVEPVYTPDLREMNFGAWEGLTFREIREQYKGEISRWQEEWVTMAAPEGESFQDMSSRVLKIFREIRRGGADKAVIVSHGGCIRAVLGEFIMGDPGRCWKFFIENGAVTRLCFDGDFAYLKALNQQ